MEDKVLPQDLTAEKAVISLMIADENVRETAILNLEERDFYTKSNRVIFSIIRNMHNKAIKIDGITLKSELEKENIKDEDLVNYLKSVIEYSPKSGNIEEYIKIITNKSTLRAVISFSESLSKDCYDNNTDLDTLVEKIDKKLISIFKNKLRDEYIPISEIVRNTVDLMAEAAERHQNGNRLIGLSTSFDVLDKVTLGFRKSDLILVAARPAMGKTSFVLNILSDVVLRQKKSAVFFSLEMPKEQLVQRMLSISTEINMGKINTGNLTDKEWGKIFVDSGNIASSKLIIDDNSDLTLAKCRSKCRKYKAEDGIDMIIIDYLQLMSSDRYSDQRQQQIAEISRGLKIMARELEVPVIALSQLSRGVEKREDKRPLLSDLRDSGAIEQDADIVMFLYRDSYYKKDKDDEAMMQEIEPVEVIIAKHRNGEVGTVEIGWKGECTKFVNMEVV